jgi:hypothetical protein
MLFELSAIVRAAGCVAQPATSIAETAIIIISLFMVLNVCKGGKAAVSMCVAFSNAG